jgi:hypothetical protein
MLWQDKYEHALGQVCYWRHRAEAWRGAREPKLEAGALAEMERWELAVTTMERGPKPVRRPAWLPVRPPSRDARPGYMEAISRHLQAESDNARMRR